MLDLRKALDASAAGSILVDPEVDKIIGDLVERRYPLRNLLPRLPGDGQSWLLNRRDSPGTTVAEWIGDTADPVEDNGVYTRHTFTYRTILSRGKVTRKLQATGRSYSDVLADEMVMRTRDFASIEEKAYLLGSNGAVANEPDGLQWLTPAGQCVATTTVSGGDNLTLDMLDQLVDKIGTDPMRSLLIGSKRTMRRINSLMQAQQMFIDSVEVAGGFRLRTYNGTPLLPSIKMVDTQTFDGNKVTSDTTGATSSLFAIDLDNVFIGELTPLTAVPLAKKSSQYDEFDIYCDEVLVVRSTLGTAKLIGIK